MGKLAALLAHIRDAKAVAPERIEAVVESGETDFSGSRVGPDLLLYRLRYTAVVELWGVTGSLKDELLANMLPGDEVEVFAADVMNLTPQVKEFFSAAI